MGATGNVGGEASFNAVSRRLEAVGQEHVLRFSDGLSEERRQALLEYLAALDLEGLPRLVEEYVKKKPRFELPADVRPAPYYRLDTSSPEGKWDRAGARARGAELLRAGKVAAFTVAGGQGSRLGYEGPKGCYPAGAVSKKPLFEIFAEGLLAAKEKFTGKAPPPWYIMTSPLNHAATVAFFEERRFFGLPREGVVFFPQGVMPTLDIRTGKMLMASKWEVATNPDGHGGAFKALWTSGSIADMKRRGVEHLSYFQVDNPLVRVVDPVFIGLHAGAGGQSSGEMSSKMIPKAYPDEKLGLFCGVDGRVVVIEYSDLPREMQHQRLENGTLRFLSGSIAVHMLGVEFVERVSTERALELPYHRAEKKVACVDPGTGEMVNPSEDNAVKLERFVFDALPLCARSAVLETDRAEEFAPIKSATGVDSVESCREIQTERAARWLRAVGVSVPVQADGKPDCVLEVSPRTALEAEDLKGRNLPRVIEKGAAIAL